MERRRVMLTVLPAFAALVALGIWRLNRESLWVDEVFALASTHDLGLTLRETKGTMGLYYGGLWVWSRGGDAAWWLRAFSLLGAGVTVVLVARIAHRLLGRRIAWLAPLLLIGVPIFAWIATEARAYAWESAVVALSWWFVIRGTDAFEREDPTQTRWWIALGVACALGPLTHGLFILQIPGFLGIVLLAGAQRHELFRRIGPAVLAALPLTLAIYLAGGSSMGAIWAFGISDRVNVLRVWLLSPIGWVAWIVGLAFIVGLATALRLALTASTLSSRVNASIPVLWALSGPLSAILVAETGGPFAPYYVAASTPGIALVVAGLFRTGPMGAGVALRSRSVIPWALAILIISSVAFASVQRPISLREDWRGAAKMVANAAIPGDTIVFGRNPGSAFGSDSTVLGFAAAWREIQDPPNLSVASHEWDLSRPVVRQFPSVELPALRKAWEHSERVWFVDYHGIGESSGFLQGPWIRNRWCVVESASFYPSIVVRLYKHRAATVSCVDP